MSRQKEANEDENKELHDEGATSVSDDTIEIAACLLNTLCFYSTFSAPLFGLELGSYNDKVPKHDELAFWRGENEIKMSRGSS